jgi:hypothetical protein
MKKVYFTILTVGLAFSGISQKVDKSVIIANKKLANAGYVSPKPTTTPLKAGGDVVWSDNFSTPSNWVIDNDGQVSTATDAYGWDIGATEQSWWTNSVINSTSDGNFAELNNGRPSATTQALDVQYTLTTASPIDVNALSGGSNNYILEFQQYGARFYEAQEVYISVDNINWTLVGSNNDIEMLTADGGAAYANPTVKTINLSGFIPGGTNSLWIRFSWTSEFPTSTNANVWVAYGWMIDDVRILEAYPNEFKVSTVFTGDIVNNWDYYSIPTAQAIEKRVGVIISNEGGTAQTKAVSIDITSGGTSVFSGTTPSVSYAPGVVDTVWFDTGFTPTATGLYTVTATLPADDLPTNNSASENFVITNYLYGHNHPLGTGRFAFSQEAEIGIGNIYEAQADQLLKGIDVAFATGTTGGIFLDVFLYELASTSVQDPSNNIVADLSIQLPTAVNTSTFTTLVFPSPYTMEAGKTYYAIVRTSQTATEKMRIKSSLKGDADFSTVIYGPFGTGGGVNNFLGWDAAAAVSLNFDPVLSINSANTPVSFGTIFPNPTTDETTINYSLANATDVAVVVVDVTGRVMYTAANENKTAGEHSLTVDASAFASGVYHVNVITPESTVTTKFIKR